MSVSSTKSNAKLIEALHSTNWRQPVMYFHEDHGGPAVDKKKRSRNSSSSLDPGYHSAHQYGSVHEASPVRVASSSHSIADPFSDASGCVIKGSKDTHSSSVGLLSGIAVADDAVAVPAKRAASAFLDIHRSSRKGPETSTFVFDFVFQHDECYDKKTCRTHNGDFPMAEIMSIEDPDHPCSPSTPTTRPAPEDTDETHTSRTQSREDPTNPCNSPGNFHDEAARASAAIFTDSAVLNIEGLHTQDARKTNPISKADQYNELMAKLSKASKEKKMQEMIGMRPMENDCHKARRSSHRQRDQSDDSGVGIRPTGRPHHLPTNLDPTAKEFIVDAAPCTSTTHVVNKSPNDRISPRGRIAAKERAFIDAISCLAEYAKECKSLQEMVQNNIQQHDCTEFATQESSVPMPVVPPVPNVLPFAPLAGYPNTPCIPAPNPCLPPNAGPQGVMMPPPPGFAGPSFGFSDNPLPMLPPFGPADTPFHMMPGLRPLPTHIGPIMHQPPPPGYHGPLPMPPPAYG
ncbi:uncharacterized protein VDAG_08686 [Verticillium dahliae VdLs.17]|uniref:Uncharacterized protein n=1 Tax=Verticillium dahliae (strain VdLs.17 / ATCC MYA-4575 / FGSC 10137) TaxID=498257 RepID=G2XEV1_VERDV|nr:uncharacterized protein VDAG_08686 [Verticillium dahliae VdLs.17]EGY18352.1 hypothetical protein VDAG_08686 [Verticillium dahliae VdLs.17]KAH6709753.1 hypothetical protein EV126DRAFT_2321 [Verticillium dahliae]